jgi:hypothetical protein
MKRALMLLLAVVVVAGLTGCAANRGRRSGVCMGGSCAQAPENGQSCDASCDASCGPLGDPSGDPSCRPRCKLLSRLRSAREVAEAPAAEEAAPGPAVGGVTYPYYTTRGPRDFLAKNPPGIGP